MGIIYSFTNWSGFSLAGSKFVGFANYADAFQDTDFLTTFLRTFLYAFFVVLFVNVIGFILALIVTQKFKTNNTLRSIFFMPNLIGGLILGFIWQFVFEKLFVFIGQTLNMSNIFFNWLLVPKTSFASLIIVQTWQMAGYVMIVYIAGLQSIPGDLIEAAQIDGANSFQRLKSITVPLMMPSFTVSLFLVLSAAFKQYDTNLSLNQGGPYLSTQLVAMNIYNTAFNHNQMVLAQAKSLIFFLVIMAITVVQVRITSEREVEA